MTVHVSAKDLCLGERLLSEKCAITLAISDQLPDANIHTSECVVEIGTDKYALPKAVETWVEHDQKGIWQNHKPFSFDMELDKK